MIKNTKKVFIAIVFGAIAIFNYGNSLLSLTSEQLEQTIVIKDSPASWLFSVPGKMIFETLDPRKCSNQTMLLSADLEEVERHLWWDWAKCKKFDKHFNPERAGGRFLLNAFSTLHILPTEYKYTDPDPIVAAYGDPMRWTFDTVEEFRVAKDHFQRNIFKTPNPNLTQRSILLLEIAGKAYTSTDVVENTTLSVDDKDFLKKYFEIPEDLAYLRRFFGESLDLHRETTGRVEGSGPEAKYKTMGESIFHFTLKGCKEFKYEKAALLAFSVAALFCVMACKDLSTNAIRSIWSYFKPLPKDNPLDVLPLHQATIGQLAHAVTLAMRTNQSITT